MNATNVSWLTDWTEYKIQNKPKKTLKNKNDKGTRTFLKNFLKNVIV